MADAPALYYAQNVGVEVLAGKDPVAYGALNIGVEPLAGADPVAYGAENIGDWVTPKVDDTLGPEFAFAPVLDSLVPDFGREGQRVTAHGTGFGDEKTFVRWGKTGTAGGVAGGDAKAGPGVIDSTVAPWTVETWFRSQQQGAYDAAAGQETGELVQLLTTGGGVKYSLELASGKVKVAGPASESVMSAVAYDDGKWHHARAVLKPDDSLHLLVDGIPLGSVASSSAAVAKAELAQSYRGDQRAARVMSADLGTNIFTPDWTPSADAATVALWQMDDGAGATLADTSGNGHDLTISGSDYLWMAWDFDIQVTLKAAVQGLDVDDVRNNELQWTVAVGAESGQALVKHTAKHVDQSDSKTFTVLPVEPLRGVGFEVRVYDKDNYATLLAVLENAFGVSFSLELSGPGAGSFKLNLNDPKATSANLQHGNLVRIFYDAVERFAYRIESVSEALVQAEDATGQVATVDGRGVLAALDDAIIYPPNWPSMTPLETTYIGATLGEILDDQVTKALARGALAGVTADFDATHDSAGAEWLYSFSLDYFPGMSLHQVLKQAVGLGLDARMTSSLVLQLYEELGVDRATGDSPTVFAQGDNLLIDNRGASSTDIKNVMLVMRGDTLMEQHKVSDFPRREAFLDARQTEDLTTGQEIALRTLETLDAVSDSFNAEVLSVYGRSEAFVDWDLGDTVLVNIPDLQDRQSFRIRSVTVEQVEDRAKFTVTLGSLQYEYVVRLKQMLDAFTGGALLGSTGGGLTATMSPNLVNLFLNAPSDAQYLLLQNDLALPSARKLVLGTGLSAVDGGAGGDYTVNAHLRYTDIEAVAAVEAEDPLDLAGAVNIAKYVDLDSIADPGAPAAGKVRLFGLGDHIISICEDDHWHDLSMGGGSGSASVHEECTVSDEGGLNIKWSAGEIFDPTILGGDQMVVIPAQTVNQACAASSFNWLYYDSSDNAQLKLTASVSDIDWGDGDIPVAHILTSHDDIVDIHQVAGGSTKVHEIEHGLAHAIEKAIFSGMIVSEHPAVNAFDVDQSAGAFVHSGFMVLDVAKIESTVTDIIRWFHDAGDAWTSDASSQIDAANWNDDDDGAAVIGNNAARYYRSVFACDGTNIHWVYPQVEYATINQALTAPNPELPPVLQHLPLTTALVMKGNDAALPAAGSDRWIDVRPLVGAVGTGGTITSHLNLADIGADDHHTEVHVLAATGPHTGTLPWGDLNKTGSSIADLATRTHASLSDAPAGAHHVAFVLGDHTAIGDAAPHHAKYTGGEAITAIEAADPLELAGVLALAKYIEFDEIAAPGAGAADKLRLYTRDEGGVSVLCTVDSAGLETVLGEGTKAFAFFMG